MKKLFALVLMTTVGAMAVGCEPEKPAPKVPKSDLGEAGKAPEKTGDTKAPEKTPDKAPKDK